MQLSCHKRVNRIHFRDLVFLPREAELERDEDDEADGLLERRDLDFLDFDFLVRVLPDDSDDVLERRDLFDFFDFLTSFSETDDSESSWVRLTPLRPLGSSPGVGDLERDRDRTLDFLGSERGSGGGGGGVRNDLMKFVSRSIPDPRPDVNPDAVADEVGADRGPEREG